MFEKNIGYDFKDKELLKRALTHKSYANKDKISGNNERLEFLGDSILGFTVAEYLYKNYNDLPEGELTKVRSMVVCEPTLYKIAKKAGLGEMIFMGKGEEQSLGRNRPSILSDALEAVFAAIYLDGGIDVAKEIILKLLIEEIKISVKDRAVKDYKTILQELVQKNSLEAPKYIILKEEGPDHDKVFSAAVSLKGEILGEGTGKTKKEAEKDAARAALEKLRK